VLLNARLGDGRLLIIARARSTKRLDGFCRIPLLEDVDSIRFERIGGQVEVDAVDGARKLDSFGGER
jgi:hypothetical protein